MHTRRDFFLNTKLASVPEREPPLEHLDDGDPIIRSRTKEY